MKHWPFPFWIAHRGAGKLAPENTLAAFRVGARHGYRAFECDVKLSADGVPFLLHDSTLERTTPARGVAGLRPWAELSQLDAGGWHSPAYVGEPLPSLAAIAHYVQRHGFALNLELKPTKGVEHVTGHTVGTACAALWQGVDTPLLFSSFKPEALHGAREAAAHIPRALLLDRPWDGWLGAAQGLDCVAVVTNFRYTDAALVARLHGAGLKALCYTVNDLADVERLRAAGVDGLITDAVDRFGPDGG